MKTIPQIIRHIRKDLLHESQEEFSARIGKNRLNVTKYETGSVIPPGDVLLSILALVITYKNSKAVMPRSVLDERL